MALWSSGKHSTAWLHYPRQDSKANLFQPKQSFVTLHEWFRPACLEGLQAHGQITVRWNHELKSSFAVYKLYTVGPNSLFHILPSATLI